MPLLLLSFGITLVIWLFEIVKPVFQISFSVIPELFSKWLIQSNSLKISGAAFIIFSLILLSITMFHFKSSLRFGLDKNNAGRLITTGIFSFSRNPFFLSIELYFLGVLFILPNLFFLVFTILAILSIHIFILIEEKFLQKVYREEYQKYTEKVRRYF